jgi:hypothetical protein
MVLELPGRGAAAPSARRDLVDVLAAPLSGLLADGGVRVGGVARPRVRR